MKVGSNMATDDTLWNPAITNAFYSVMWESPFLFCFTSHTEHGQTSLHVSWSCSDTWGTTYSTVISNKIKPRSHNVSMWHTPTWICPNDNHLRNLKSASNQVCWVEELHGYKTMFCPLRSDFHKLFKGLGSCACEQLINRHVRAGYAAFVVTWPFSSSTKVSQLRQDLQPLSSDDHVIQWICLL